MCQLLLPCSAKISVLGSSRHFFHATLMFSIGLPVFFVHASVLWGLSGTGDEDVSERQCRHPVAIFPTSEWLAGVLKTYVKKVC